MSSISGSYSDTEDDITILVNNLELDNNELSEKKISEPILWFTCSISKINLGIYKNTLINLGEKAIEDINKLQIKPNNEENPRRLWTMLMIRGGHVAALILDITTNAKVTHAKEVKALVHKTFHRYTSKDN